MSRKLLVFLLQKTEFSFISDSNKYYLSYIYIYIYYHISLYTIFLCPLAVRYDVKYDPYIWWCLWRFTRSIVASPSHPRRRLVVLVVTFWPVEPASVWRPVRPGGVIALPAGRPGLGLCCSHREINTEHSDRRHRLPGDTQGEISIKGSKLELLHPCEMSQAQTVQTALHCAVHTSLLSQHSHVTPTCHLIQIWFFFPKKNCWTMNRKI